MLSNLEMICVGESSDGISRDGSFKIAVEGPIWGQKVSTSIKDQVCEM